MPPSKQGQSKFNAFVHFRELKKALLQHEMVGVLNMDSFEVVLQKPPRTWVLYPKFLEHLEGKPMYTNRLTSDAVRFIGWRPYVSKTFRASSNKITFKRLVRGQGFLTPAYAFQTSSKLHNVLVKKNKGSFGQEIQGPFRESEAYGKLESDAFFEQFIEGKIVKIWYWNQRPVCMEIQDMLHIEGDAVSTIEDHIKSKGELFESFNRESIATLLAFYGTSLESILPQGEQQLINFRYLPDRLYFVKTKDYAIPSKETEAFVPELMRLGALLWKTASQEISGDVVYTVDAILDKDNALWFLEVNANPLVHTLLYSVMIKALSTGISETKE